MSLRERLTVHTSHETHLVLVAQARQVDRQAATTPNELQVSTSFNIAPGLKHAPESWDNLVVTAVVRESRNALKALHRDVLLSSAAGLQSLPGKEIQDCRIVFKNLKETFPNSLHLKCSLIAASLKHLSDKLFNVVFGNPNALTTFTKRDLFAAAKYGREILLDSGLKIFVT